MKKLSLIAIVLCVISLVAIYCTDYDFNNPYDSRNLPREGGGDDEVVYYCPAACAMEIGASRPDGCFSSQTNCLASQVVDPNDVVHGTIQDSRDGKTYRTVMIGTQTWMAENLNFEMAIGSWCYDDDTDNCEIYGRMYDWNTAVGACPAGWHLPSVDEWNILITAVGGEATAGTKLKSQNLGWTTRSDNITGTDDYGFSAMASGVFMDNRFFNIEFTALWWTSTEDGGGRAYKQRIMHNLALSDSYSDLKVFGVAVRCVR